MGRNAKLIITKQNQEGFVLHPDTDTRHLQASEVSWTCSPLPEKHNYCKKQASIYAARAPTPPTHTTTTPCIGALILTGCDICYPFLFQTSKSIQDFAHLKGLAGQAMETSCALLSPVLGWHMFTRFMKNQH